MRVPEANHFHKPIRNDRLSATRLWSQPHPRAQCPVYNSQFAIVRSSFIVALQLLSLPVKTYVLWRNRNDNDRCYSIKMADKSMESNSAFILFWKLKNRPTTWYIFTSVILKTILSSWWTGTLLQKIYSNKEVESVKNTFVIFRPIILKKRSGFVNDARNIARFLRPLFKHHHFLDNKVAAKKLKRATT